MSPDIQLVLRACPRNVAVLRHVFAGVGEVLGMDARCVGRLKLAVSEAGSNVVIHAYGDGECGVLEVDALIEDALLHVIVRDRGDGLRPRPDSPGSAWASRSSRRSATAWRSTPTQLETKCG